MALTHICVFCPHQANLLWGVKCQSQHLQLPRSLSRSLFNHNLFLCFYWATFRASTTNQETCVVLWALHNTSLKMFHQMKSLHVEALLNSKCLFQSLTCYRKLFNYYFIFAISKSMCYFSVQMTLRSLSTMHLHAGNKHLNVFLCAWTRTHMLNGLRMSQ